MEATTSTNILALEASQKGAIHGTVFATDYQTHGRGRQGSSWIADKGLNLIFSIILDLPVSRAVIGMTPMAACLGVADAISDTVSPNKLQFKWPNDVVLNDRKICGMLLQTANQAITKVVLGIGLNVNQSKFPDDLEKYATSLLLSTGQPIDRAPLMASVLLNLEKRIDQLLNQASAIRKLYMERLIWLGENCSVTGLNQDVNGILLGIAESGALLLETNIGIKKIYAGNVSLRVADN